MQISLIVAMAENRVIGRNGTLPWHLPKDLKRFKKLTVGHSILMGRKTFESIGRPLPKRRSLVLSSDPSYRPPGAEVFGDLATALAATAREPEVFVIGGARVFADTLPLAHRLYLTLVHAAIEGDVRFPELETAAWQLTSEEAHPADAKHAHPFSFLCYEPRQLPAAPPAPPDSSPGARKPPG